jgi:glycosyltransferase involved in cell wall biosynthesis
MSKPLVTVLMPTYNQAKYIQQALDSLRVQTLSSYDFKVIVVNDGSTDETSKILKNYREWIQLIERDNQGLVASCNEGLALVEGRYFARLDSDDFVAPEWLRCLVDALESSPNACCAYPDRFEKVGDQWHYIQAQAENLYSLEACGTLFRTNAVRQVGGFRDFYWEEYDLYLRLRQRGEFVHIDEPLYMYRKHSNSMTHVAAKRIEGWLELVQVWGVETLKSAGFDDDLDRALKLLKKETNY